MPYTIKKGVCPNCDLCLTCEIARKAIYNRDAVFPFQEEYKTRSFGHTQHGAEYDTQPRRFYNLDDLILLPPLFSRRVSKKEELGREPIFADVDTKVELGGFKLKYPVVMAAMGSTDIASTRGINLGKGAAKSGIIHIIGENEYHMRGFDRRVSADHPSLVERALAYLENMDEYGGLLIQANVEDRGAKVWEKIVSFPKFDAYLQQKKIGFEIKLGQGAKAGLGGEVKVTKEEAKRLNSQYMVIPDPDKTDKPLYERHSVPGTMTERVLEELIKDTKRYGLPVWVKTGPYKDVERQIEVAERSGADAITIDGKEGGTGMSPSVAMNELGYPTIKCLQIINSYKTAEFNVDMIIAGGLRDGADVVKSLCLGADSVGMSRPFVIAEEAGTKKLEGGDGAKGVQNFVESTGVEIQMLVSSLGEYDFKRLDKSFVGALKEDVAKLFEIEYVYGQ